MMYQYTKTSLITLMAVTVSIFSSLAQQSDETLHSTPWTAKVNANLPLNEYPRPNMERKNWQNLNGKWEYAILPVQEKPQSWQGQITVPFPVESYLSGVQKTVGKDNCLWYKKIFSTKSLKASEKLLLHFGAVDWQAEVWINGKLVGKHEGGYTAFSFDITAFLQTGQQEIILKVWDPTDDGQQARGKQVKRPGGIYYTPVTGIWQTVWLETVPESYIETYKIITDIDQNTVSIKPEGVGLKSGDKFQVKILNQKQKIASSQTSPSEVLEIKIPNAKLWTPEKPNLYDFELSIIRNGKAIDAVKGYFGMRKIAMMPDKNGVNRLFLNNKPVFQYGPLDQGYWPDGIYTAPTEEALVSDIELMKKSGFNMVRKHVKIEPLRWYYQCDKLGLLVWQDMPSGHDEIVPVKDHDHSIEGDFLAKKYNDVTRTAREEALFKDEWQAIIKQLYNFPSICMWVPFNESWGQFKTNEILKWTKSLDPTRLVDGPSGWIDRGEGDTHDFHMYGSRLKAVPTESHRALVIGEFGGLGHTVVGHTFSKNAWSYQGFKTEDELFEAYKQLIIKIKELKKLGFAAAVYTQLTDVETEINGLITYDREKLKINYQKLKQLHDELIYEE